MDFITLTMIQRVELQWGKKHTLIWQYSEWETALHRIPSENAIEESSAKMKIPVETNAS